MMLDELDAPGVGSRAPTGALTKTCLIDALAVGFDGAAAILLGAYVRA